jgi:hypothetical protein
LSSFRNGQSAGSEIILLSLSLMEQRSYIVYRYHSGGDNLIGVTVLGKLFSGSAPVFSRFIRSSVSSLQVGHFDVLVLHQTSDGNVMQQASRLPSAESHRRRRARKWSGKARRKWQPVSHDSLMISVSPAGSRSLDTCT